MLVDVEADGRATFEREFDVCVIGTGPAGTTLARRLAARGLEVALMEARRARVVRGVAGGRRRRERRAPLPRPRRRAAALSRRLVRALERALPAARRGGLRSPRRRTRTAAGRSPGPSSTPMPPRSHEILDLVRDRGRAGRERAGGGGRLPPDPLLPQRPDPLRREVSRRARRLRADRARHQREPRRPAPRRRRRPASPRRGSAPTPRRIPASRSRAKTFALCCGGIENARLLLNFQQPAPGRDREPERPGRTLLQRSSGHAAGARRGDLHPDATGGDAVFRPLRGVRGGARHAADAAAHQLPRAQDPAVRQGARPQRCSAPCPLPSG